MIKIMIFTSQENKTIYFILQFTKKKNCKEFYNN